MDLSSLDIHAPNFDKDFTQHEIFSQLDDLINFYDMLSFSTMGFISSGLIGVINLNTHVFTSIKGTIDSIKLVLNNGRINDATQYWESSGGVMPTSK